MPRVGPGYSEEEAREAIASSLSFAEALRRLGKCSTGGAGRVLKKWTVRWGISTDHFDQYAASRNRVVKPRIPLTEVLVERSSYDRGHLKKRLVCPNCAATLDTHCARKLRAAERQCALCGASFRPKYAAQRYCSAWCGQRHDRSHLRGPRPEARKVERPPYEQLLVEVREMGYCTVGRKYGVSDNAVRKWLRVYERELKRAA